MLKAAKENIKENATKNFIKRTSTFNQSNFRRNLNKTRAKLRSLQKDSLILLNQILKSDDKELILFKKKLFEAEELRGDINAINLIYLIYQLNGSVPKCYFDIKDPDNEALYVTNKIFFILKNYNFFFFFFSHYHIDDKSILKIIPLLGYQFYAKNKYIYKEGDNSSKMFFILKGRISFSKKINSLEFEYPQDVEQYQLGEGKFFGEWDLVYGRKTKVSAQCLENCHIIYMHKETFQKYIQEQFTKIESDSKANLVKILTNYLYMPQVKLERFVNSYAKMIFFKKGEIIYNEGEENRYLYLINEGEANLLKNITNGEEDSLITNSFDDIKIEKIQKKAKNIDYKELFNHPLKNNNNRNSFKLDLKLNKNKYQIVATLAKGSFAGLEIVTGVSNFKYTLISNSNFTSVYKINIKNLDEHLKELMLNLIPLFFDLEEKIHTQIDNIKYIDYNIMPDSCKKYKNENRSNRIIGIDSTENDDTFSKQIKKIENKFEINEGGFIKMNKNNIDLHKKRNILRDQLKENQLKDQKIDIFVKNYEKEQLANLKYKKVRLIHSAKNKKIKMLKKNNSFLYSSKKSRPISCFTNKISNISALLKEGKDNSNYNASKSILKSSNSSLFVNKTKSYNLFYKEEMIELRNKIKKKWKKPKILLYKMPKNKFTIDKIKQSLSIDSKTLVKKVFVKRKKEVNKSQINTYNYKFKSSIFPFNKINNKKNFITINVSKNKGHNINKNTIINNKNVNKEKIYNIRKLYEEEKIKKFNFYDTGIFDMPLAIQLGAT